MDDLRSTIARVAQEEGIDPAYALAVADRESSFNPRAHASKTIYGLFQMNRGERMKYGAGDSTDPVTQTRAFAGYTRDLRGEMTSELGRPPNNSELYLGHYWGGARAARVIGGSYAGASPADIFTPKELAENPNLARGKSAGGLASSIMSDMDRRQAKYGGEVQVAQNGGAADFSRYGRQDEGDRLQDNYDRNKAWTAKGAKDFNTDLGDQEPSFRQWVKDNKVPFDPDAQGPQDYDMRGFYKGLQANDPMAKQAVDPNDGKMHYPDYWKTPYHETFSNESQWADPTTAPKWNDKDQLVTPDGQILFDDRAKPKPDSGTGNANVANTAPYQTPMGSDLDPAGSDNTALNYGADGLSKALSNAGQAQQQAASNLEPDQPSALAQPSTAYRPGQEIDISQFKVAGIPAMPTMPGGLMPTQTQQPQQGQPDFSSFGVAQPA